MTENEAKYILNEIMELDDSMAQYNLAYMKAMEVAINALEEVQQYRAIGKISTCQNAVEICKAMIERGIEPDNIVEYIKYEDDMIQRGYDLKRLLEMMEEHKQYRAIGTPEELRSLKENGAFTGIELAQLAVMQMRLREYEQIGTPEECRAVREKQIPKRPIGLNMCTCPFCYTQNEIWKKRRNIAPNDIVYCWHCGQAVEILREDGE